MSYREQVITSINAGIDMLMEVERFDEAKQIIIDAVKSGEISEERVDDAVTRIIRVKKRQACLRILFSKKRRQNRRKPVLWNTEKSQKNWSRRVLSS